MALLDTVRELSPRAARLALRTLRGRSLSEKERLLVDRFVTRAARLEQSRAEFDAQPWVLDLVRRGRSTSGGSGSPAHPSPTRTRLEGAPLIDARTTDRESTLALMRARGITDPDVLAAVRDPVRRQLDPAVQAELARIGREHSPREQARRERIAALPTFDARTASPEQVRERLRQLGIDGTLAAELGETLQRPPPSPAQRASVPTPDLAAGRRREVELERKAFRQVAAAIKASGGRIVKGADGRARAVGGSYDVRRASPLHVRAYERLRGLAPAPW
jgi:hypothetical protein